MIDLLHILPYQYEDTFYNAFLFTCIIIYCWSKQ